MSNKNILNSSIKKIHPSEGHRKRLREKFLEFGLSGFLDYEIVELLLTLGTPRKDCKAIAKEAIKNFKTLKGVLDADVSELTTINGIGMSNVLGIILFRAISEQYSKEKISPKILLNSSKLVAEYLQTKIGNKKEEHFMILYFDTRNKLINEEISIGTLNASLVHPREVFKKAIKDNIAQIIVAHNHPSGDPNPSEEDISTTNRLIEVGKLVGISIIDHLVITLNDYFSFKEKGIITTKI
ncbi:MAG: repair protein radC-like protein [Candidatus Daviesbacteria bacterium GW2011_GWF2_38_6]|uniref:Repair protein radC-like protein n=1 Tax=Candidatus Daviesbacteria bacterium GW2011_GWF2_38_6 TaxID=1618432 RepID=A0A0G0KHS6_9BACT|nr:MAG: repair protein radC-like protein [Candidatus Daviesbacteria bacterium GW2011_GWF2_38_6]